MCPQSVMCEAVFYFTLSLSYIFTACVWSLMAGEAAGCLLSSFTLFNSERLGEICLYVGCITAISDFV